MKIRPRLIVGLAIAFLLAFSVEHAMANGIWEAACAAWPKGSPEWITLGCFLL